tara:strand:+ start:18335 stop:18736 length:402 start_codon:yes stop_codon:yes gene_type:complete
MEDKKYKRDILDGISREEVQKLIDRSDTTKRVLQQDYFETLTKLIDVRVDVITNKDNDVDVEESMDRAKDEMFYIRKMKELQTGICHHLNYSRELQLDLSKSALEDAFTPRIKSMIIDSYKEKIKELEEDDVL